MKLINITIRKVRADLYLNLKKHALNNGMTIAEALNKAIELLTKGKL